MGVISTMNLQVALNKSAKKFGYRDYLNAQRAVKNPWWLIDEVILGDYPVDSSESNVAIDGESSRISSEAVRNPLRGDTHG